MSDRELQLHIRGVILLLLSMVALAMVSAVAHQNWSSKVTPYPTKTEAAVHDYATQLLSTMTLEEKLGQMVIAMNLSDAERGAELALGGVLLGDANLGDLTADEVAAVVNGFQAGAEIPMFIGVNEEGGAVNTLSRYPSIRAVPYLSPSELMTTGGLGLVEADARDKCRLLRSMGINLNFAPVCDVTTDTAAYMYGRALGRDGDDTARYVETVVEVMADEQLLGALKHFPGYGNLAVAGDSEVLIDTRAMDRLAAEDLLSFAEGIKAGGRIVMMGHSVVACIDPQEPASLSRKVHNFLRREYDFDGVVVSGPLDAKGLSAYGTPAELAVAAVRAGSDLLLTADYEVQLPALVQAVMAGEISRERIDESVLRILELKIEYGIIE